MIIYHSLEFCNKSREAILAVGPSKLPLSLHVSIWIFRMTKLSCPLPILGCDREEGDIEGGGIPIHEVASP